MALSNRLGNVSWHLEGDSIVLQSSITNQKKLEDATGMGFFEFIGQLDDARRNPLRQMARLFHFLQDGTKHSEEEIYNCFFADVSAYGDTFQELQDKFIDHLMGNKESRIIMEAQKNEEKKVEN